ncbi:hypothetical protein PHAVU_009G136300 [Phaseolus vulgaris]|uniref:SnoaL-like domain-containing protein n=1 Tax=Phaseolus vulgaris TaxID=3885 RepID=V7AZ83_PHAVU|nr:hypothetical protein PHAVU_009G136300g [Phaseolus vulgaris]ESW09546.1 hypothetical protein PHAVU_009G136300g [Phaseolus vulgaris]
MASLPQLSATLGACISSKIKSIDALPCSAQLSSSNKKSAGALFPLTLVREKRPKIESWKQQSEKWKVWAGESSELVPRSDVENVVKDFHRAFNGKNIEQLKQLIWDDCEYQDYLFYSPYKGQGNVIKFLQNVMEAMGPNIKIAVGEINVEDVKEAKLMATVFWHLEWGNDKKKLPFSKGCRFFWFKEVDGKLVISKITGLEELPIKPGELALNALKAISTFLDSYPPMAAVLLNYPAFQDD